MQPKVFQYDNISSTLNTIAQNVTSM